MHLRYPPTRLGGLGRPLTPAAWLADGVDAVAALREHAAALRIDPERVIAGGGSAGGHVAVALCVCPLGVGPAAALVPPSARPNACVAFNPNLQIVGLHEWGATTPPRTAR